MELVSIGIARHSLREDAAASFARMVADGMPAVVTSSTRSLERQRRLFRNQGKEGWPPKAARPESSKHVWRPADTRDTGGRALDLPGDARAWVRERGADYGWIKDRVSREPWHMEYEPRKDAQALDAEEVDMLDDADKEFLRALLRSEPEVTDRLMSREELQTTNARGALRRILVLSRRSERRLIELDAQVTGLVAVVAQLARGEPLDEARLVAAVREAAHEGARAAVAADADLVED
ncbi:MAG: hypothetical protein GX593_03115 [Actinomycetales bacterium]|nr:hypothetical protein [Actinomycetales bacterium]